MLERLRVALFKRRMDRPENLARCSNLWVKYDFIPLHMDITRIRRPTNRLVIDYQLDPEKFRSVTIEAAPPSIHLEDLRRDDGGVRANMYFPLNEDVIISTTGYVTSHGNAGVLNGLRYTTPLVDMMLPSGTATKAQD